MITIIIIINITIIILRIEQAYAQIMLHSDTCLYYFIDNTTVIKKIMLLTCILMKISWN